MLRRISLSQFINLIRKRLEASIVAFFEPFFDSLFYLKFALFASYFVFIYNRGTQRGEYRQQRE